MSYRLTRATPHEMHDQRNNRQNQQEMHRCPGDVKHHEPENPCQKKHGEQDQEEHQAALHQGANG